VGEHNVNFLSRKIYVLLVYYPSIGKKMEKDDNTAHTPKGEHVAVFIKNVAVIFKKVTSEGLTTVKEPKKKPPGPNGEKIIKYYKIKTTAEYKKDEKGDIKIRLALPWKLRAEERKLWQWDKTNNKWYNITKYYNSEYNFIVGKTKHISIFGVT